MDPFSEQVKSAEHVAKIIEHKFQIRVLKPISKCLKRLKMRYLQIHKFLFKNVILLTIDGFHSDVIKFGKVKIARFYEFLYTLG